MPTTSISPTYLFQEQGTCGNILVVRCGVHDTGTSREWKAGELGAILLWAGPERLNAVLFVSNYLRAFEK